MAAKNYQISASILSANFACLGQEVEKVLSFGADMIHIDVMDNHYVPNLSFGPVVLKSLRKAGIQASFDVHLMTTPVDSLVMPFIEAGANLISFHPDATIHVDRTLQLIQSHGVKAGIALNPATPLALIEHVWDKIDLLLIMSVNPGFGGQKFIVNQLEKIKAARQIIATVDHDIILAVDGGIGPQNIAEVAKAGADTFIVGSALFDSQDYQATMKQLRDALSAL